MVRPAHPREQTVNGDRWCSSFFFFIAMIHLIHMQQDLFVWQQLNVAAGLDFVCVWGCGTKSMCGQYGGVVWVSKDQTGFN